VRGTRWEHRWGYTDTYFEPNDDDSVTLVGERYPLSGTRMYGFMPFARETLGVDLDPFDLKPAIDSDVPEPRRNEAFIEFLSERFGSHISFNPTDRLIHSHGQTISGEIYRVLYDRLERVVDVVVCPDNEQDIEATIEKAVEFDVCIVPYGGGSNVSGALMIPLDETRMVVSMDLSRMNHLLHLDRENLTATFEAGIMGSELEERLSAEGFTSGHEPDSIELSSLGGWIATNSSGMKKNRYGNIEDIVERATMLTPRGRIELTSSFPRSSIGVDPTGFMFGSEGNLGIITKATIRIHWAPEEKRFDSLLFHSVDDGIEFLAELAREGTLPASLRLVDNLQFRFGQALKGRATGVHKLIAMLQKLFVTRFLRFDPLRMVVATVAAEGSRQEINHEMRVMNRIARKHRGFSAGGENGKQGYMLTFAIAYIRDFLVSMHILGETFETTVPWSRILPLTQAVDRRLSELALHFGIPGIPFLSYRVTQLYQTGVCIYFTLGLYLKGVDDPPGVLNSVEHSLRETILEEGGSLSHHHGVGKIRKEFLSDRMSHTAAETIRGLKSASDPKNIFGAGNGVFGL